MGVEASNKGPLLSKKVRVREEIQKIVEVGVRIKTRVEV